MTDVAKEILALLTKLEPDEELVEKLEQLLEFNRPEDGSLTPEAWRHANRLAKLYRELVEEANA